MECNPLSSDSHLSSLDFTLDAVQSIRPLLEALDNPTKAVQLANSNIADSDDHADSDNSSDSVPSLRTVLDSESDSQDVYYAPKHFPPIFIPFGARFLDPWTGNHNRRDHTQAAYINIKLYYPTLLAEIAGRFLVKLEVRANERNERSVAQTVCHNQSA